MLVWICIVAPKFVVVYVDVWGGSIDVPYQLFCKGDIICIFNPS